MGLDDPGEDHWIPYADLMSGLAVIFLLIALVGMSTPPAQPTSDQPPPSNGEQAMRSSLSLELYRRLQQEFAADWQVWHAHLSADLTVRFDDPSILFDTGQSGLKPRFAAILAEFVPRYLRILTDARFSAAVAELRIEGHASSQWQGVPNTDAASLNNLLLSQDRSRTTVLAVWAMPASAPYRGWLAGRLVAAGLGSTKLIRDSHGAEDPAASQRVAFRLRLSVPMVEHTAATARALP